jgi:N-acetylmuramoyl-L-alanine amidase
LVPGHSFVDPGAVNGRLNLKEYDCVLEMTLELFKDDDWKDIDIVLKGRNTYGTLPEEINSLNADYVIELHLNAADGKAQGTEVLYCESSKTGKEMAGIIQSKLVKYLKYPDRGIKAIAVADLKVKLATLKYTKQESLVITKANVDNLTASYNYLMLKESIESYEEGLGVRWKNLDGSRVDITDDILAELESIRTQTRTHYQACFNAQEDIEAYIDTLTDSELQEVVISDLWEQYYKDWMDRLRIES